jgi:integrase
VRIERGQVELSNGTVIFTGPKTDAGIRTVHLPKHTMQEIEEHLAKYVAIDPDALLLTGRGGVPLRPKTLGTAFNKARASCDLSSMRFHDLRHFSLTMAEMSDVAVFASFRTVRDEVPPGHMNVSGDVTVGPSRDDVLVGAGIHQS